MGFSYKGKAELRNVNVRSENHGDEPVPALDMKFHVEDVPIDHLFSVLGIGDDPDGQARVKNGLWCEGGPLLSGISSINCWAKFEQGHKLGGALTASPVPADKVHKFSFKPTGIERCEFEFTVSISEPPEHLLQNAANSLKSLISINVEHDPELDFTPDNDGDEA